jgi:beta-lactamase class A
MRILVAVSLVMLTLAGPLLARPVPSLEKKVNALVAAHRGRMRAGVAIVHLEGGESVYLDAHTRSPLASVFKLPILVELARRLEAGKLSLGQSLTLREDEKIIGSGRLRYRKAGSKVTVREAIELMETISDNTATDILFNAIGLDSVDAMMHGLGFNETEIFLTNRAAWLISLGMGAPFKGLSARGIAAKWLSMSVSERKRAAGQVIAENRSTSLARIQAAESASYARPYADDMYLAGVVDNLSSPSDLASLLVKLWKGELVNPKWTAYCVGVLGRQKFNSRIPRYLPRGVRAFHKTGTIEGVVNDAGVIEIGPHNHVVVVVLVHGMARGAEGQAEDLIGRIARAGYDAFK